MANSTPLQASSTQMYRDPQEDFPIQDIHRIAHDQESRLTGSWSQRWYQWICNQLPDLPKLSFEWVKDSTLLVPLLAGSLMSLGWWVFIDVLVMHRVEKLYPPMTGRHYWPGIIGTFGMFLSVFIPTAGLSGAISFNSRNDCCSRLCTFIAFCISFASMGVALFQFIDNDTLLREAGDNLPDNTQEWLGVALIIQTLCIFLSSLLCLVHRTGRTEFQF